MQHIAHVHAAIRSALDAFAAEAAALSSCDVLNPDALSVLAERLRFLRAVCTYHSASEDDVVFPAARSVRLSDSARLHPRSARTACDSANPLPASCPPLSDCFCFKKAAVDAETSQRER